VGPAACYRPRPGKRTRSPSMPILPQTGYPVKRHAWVPEAAFELEDGAFRVYAALTIFADGRGICWPSQGELARLSRRSVRTVRDRLHWLERHGWLTIKQRRRDTAMYQLKLGSTLAGQENQDRQNENQERQVHEELRPAVAEAEEQPREHPIYKHNVAREDKNDDEVTDGIERARRTVALLGSPQRRGSGLRRVGSLL
jgi:hypothetical protein